MSSPRDNRIRRVAGLARAFLSSDAVIAVKHDHPLLYASPDILIGNSGSLIAIFFTKVSELTRPSELAARLIASRLALPTHTVCVVSPDAKGDLTTGLYSDFDAILEGIRPSEIQSLLTGSSPRRAVRRDLPEIRSEAYLRYDALLHLNKVATAPDRRKMRSVETGIENAAQRVGKPWRGSPTVRIYEGSLVGFRRTKGRRQLGAALQAYSVTSFNENYVLDTGVPYTKRREIDVAVLAEVPKSGLDPEKPFRIAAFSGWVWGFGSDFQDVEGHVEDTRRLFDVTLERMKALRDRRIK